MRLCASCRVISNNLVGGAETNIEVAAEYYSILLSWRAGVIDAAGLF
jgi:hypothetical protein